MEQKRYYKNIEIKKKIGFKHFLIFGIELLIIVFAHIFLGTLLLALTIGILLTKSGFEIDLNKNRMRNYVSCLGLIVGNWKTIPELNYISVVRVNLTKENYAFSSGMISQKSSNSLMFKINLITKSKRLRFIKIRIGGKEESINQALQIGKALDLRVLDYTSPKKQWIK